MRFAKIVVVACLIILCSCSETQYAAHLAKQVTGGTPPQTQGTFKVGNPYTVGGQRYFPQEKYEHEETGIASWYGPGFDGRRTASGERFDSSELTAAHKTLQMPSLIRVTNLDNGRSVVLRVNDRGPFSRGRVLDVSAKGAELLGFKNRGTAKVKIQVLGEESRRLAALAKSGQTTKGYEVAMNQPGNTPAASLQTASFDQAAAVPGHVAADGRFLPDPVVTNVPVTPTNIYVQAGSFTREDNALSLSQRLSSAGPSRVYLTNVNGQAFYRVRLGPYRRVEEADSALARAVSAGASDSRIVVD